MASIETAIDRASLADQQARNIENAITRELRELIIGQLTSVKIIGAIPTTEVSVTVERLTRIGFKGFRLTVSMYPQLHHPPIESLLHLTYRVLAKHTEGKVMVTRTDMSWGTMIVDFRLAQAK